MNKQELVLEIANKTNMTKAAAEKFLNAFTDTVVEALIEGDKVQIIGFGTFETTERAARNGRNPKTGGAVHIAAKTSPKFKAGKALKDSVNK